MLTCSKLRHACFLGFENGVIRMHQLKYRTHNDLEALGASAALSMHDSQGLGAVTRCISSYDDHFVFSVALDGNFFVYALDDLRIPDDRPKLVAKIPSAKVTLSILLFI